MHLNKIVQCCCRLSLMSTPDCGLSLMPTTDVGSLVPDDDDFECNLFMHFNLHLCYFYIHKDGLKLR